MWIRTHHHHRCRVAADWADVKCPSSPAMELSFCCLCLSVSPWALAVVAAAAAAPTAAKDGRQSNVLGFLPAKHDDRSIPPPDDGRLDRVVRENE